MTSRGIPSSRNERLLRATGEGKRAFLLTRNWGQTRAHIIGWLRVTYALSGNAARDYAGIVLLRLQSDPELTTMKESHVQYAARFVHASEL